jgi:hypothetical protein
MPARWTDAEREVLLAGRRAVPPREFRDIGAELGRSEKACQMEASRLGIGDIERRQQASRAGRDSKPKAVPAPKLPPRRCLGNCSGQFVPAHRFNFVCDSCKAGLTWRGAS